MENEIQNKIAVCLACDCNNQIFFIKKNGFDIYKCEKCGVLSVIPLPQQSESDSVYNKEYFSGGSKGFGYVDYDADKAAMKSVFEDYIKLIKKINRSQGSKLLDIGAATGFFIKIAKDSGYEVCGLEISDYAANIGRMRGLDIRTGSINNTEFKKDYFDVITMWDVIEHLQNPKEDLIKISSSMKSGGIIAINTPDCGSLYARILGSRWHLLVPPEHLFYFNKSSLTNILENNGFKVIRFLKIGKKFTIEYVVHTLSKWLKISQLQKLAELLSKHKIGKFALPINLRDNIIVLAKKL